MTIKKILASCSLMLVLSLLIVDRWAMSLVAQWREDQATNIYIGFHYFDWQAPVGIISSIGIPNPNGMVLLGAVLSRLPGLIAISTALGIAQLAAMLFWIQSLNIKEPRFNFIACLTLFSSYLLRVNGAEFWNQLMYSSLNFVAAGFLAQYYVKNRSAFLALAIILLFYAPSLYLAGVTNSVVYGLATLCVLVMKYRQRGRIFNSSSDMLLNCSLAVLGVATAVLLVWWPYFSTISLDQLHGMKSLPMAARVVVAAKAALLTPKWLNDLAAITTPALYKDDTVILSQVTRLLEMAIGISARLQVLIFLAVLVYAAVRRVAVIKSNGLLLLPLGLMVASYCISPLLNGPFWHVGERRDMIYQFYGCLLFSIFPACYFLAKHINGKLSAAIATNAVVFAVLNIAAGVLLIENALTYRGDYLTHCDVPMIYKAKSLRFVAEDWLQHHGGSAIPLDYNIKGLWAWIPEFGEKLNPYYSSVYTLGRGFDYELERLYGLRNVQEGVQDRKIGSGVYMISYAHDDTVKQDWPLSEHTDFGRIRVSKRHAF